MTAALRTSRTMLPEEPMDLRAPATPAQDRPLGYLYCDWDPGVTGKTGGEIDLGHYDPESQTWVDREGIVTAGVYTKTRVVTRPNMHEWWYDYPTDDACQ